MSFLSQLLSPAVMRFMALTLLHFLWQGTALAALTYAGMAFCRSAASRYAFGLALLAAMAAAPVGDDQFGEAAAGGDAGDGGADPACADEKYAHVYRS